ncbi:PREDICTED: uncharacterized protein LOC105960747 [Erythranthe guttata]|uniref:uncharacterized protein LOC105960747 n=1 Tax=Erythranthe guttata TaxID=4155 RepID=UPI00064DA3BE|nr:PREDICTED: uncharacterized protein LOC105960747 [Erythranthe guttata]|eukprot:XP_012840411.1 PREDICTED: uncharacterized protein LOC105960747 [Erythranthe guttata]
MYRNLELLNTFLTSESDDDLELLLIATQNEEGERRNRRRRGSVPGQRVIHRDRAGGNRRLYQDYFSDNPTYSDDQFRRRFRMRRPLFCRILNAVESYDPYFVQRNDAIGVPGLSSLQKIYRDCSKLTSNVDFQECLEALIACIGSGKIAQLLGKVCTLAILVHRLLY